MIKEKETVEMKEKKTKNTAGYESVAKNEKGCLEFLLFILMIITRLWKGARTQNGEKRESSWNCSKNLASKKKKKKERD